MKFFLKMQGERVWNLMEYGWGPLLILDVHGRSTRELKPKQDWDKANNKGSKANAKTLVSIFNGVCQDEFHRIENCTCTKEA